MTTTHRAWSLGIALTFAALVPANSAFAQATTTRTGAAAGGTGSTAGKEQQATPPAGRGATRPAGRGPALPAVTPNMTQQQLQTLIDAYALVQAEKDLQLSAEQYPKFVTKLTRLQNLRRRHLMERRKLMGELVGLVQSSEPGNEEAIAAHVKALDEQAERSATEIRQAYQALDSDLSPWQRGRFRMFEEQLERRKVELLSKIK